MAGQLTALWMAVSTVFYMSMGKVGTKMHLVFMN